MDTKLAHKDKFIYPIVILTRSQLLHLALNFKPRSFLRIIFEYLRTSNTRDSDTYTIDFNKIDKIYLLDKDLFQEKLKEFTCKLEYNSKYEYIFSFELDYPESLFNISQSPLQIFYIGQKSLLQNKLISIVGTRKCTNRGILEVKRLVSKCSQWGLVTVSGMAIGIDWHVHRESILNKCDTIAVLASMDYSKNVYAVTILKAKGLLISEKDYNGKYSKYDFPQRNRIISGLSEVLVVIEAPIKSGTMITANLSISEGREVFVASPRICSLEYAGIEHLLDQDLARLLTRNFTQLMISLKIPNITNLKNLNIFNQDESSIASKIIKLIASGVNEQSELCSRLGLLERELQLELAKLQFSNKIKKNNQNRLILN